MTKRLAVFLDGTWNAPESEGRTVYATNVLRLMRALLPTGANGVPQVVYYDRGVGTSGVLDRALGGAFGKGLSENVQDAYRWIANNFDWTGYDGEGVDPADPAHPRDRLFLFGFSRGAYTARSLAGLIGCVGLMRRTEIGSLPEAYAYYRTKPEQRAGHAYHATATARPKPVIDCIGVWDTVGALGIPLTGFNQLNAKYQFHDVKIGGNVLNAFHALAIDERRKPFRPAIWDKPEGWPGRLEQAWFVGAHSNVGGGYEDHHLADITLDWMICRAEEAGLEFDEDAVRPCREPVTPGRHLGAIGNPYRGFYRVIGPHVRPVAVNPARGETVDASVRMRMDEDSAYLPVNWAGERGG